MTYADTARCAQTWLSAILHRIGDTLLSVDRTIQFTREVQSVMSMSDAALEARGTTRQQAVRDLLDRL